MKTVSVSALFVLFLGFICCEATDQETPLVKTPIKFLSANTSTGRDTPSLTTIHNSLELRQLYRLHVKDILSRHKRSSNSCPLYHYPVPPGICEPCICVEGEQPKKDCGYGPSGVSDPCERCGDNHFSTDGRIDGCEVCTDCGQRGFQTTCNVNRTEDATCVCDEGQKLDKSGQCLPVCCKCRVYHSTEDTDNAHACIQAFGRPAIDGGYLCTDNEIFANHPCQDYQPPTTTPHPTTTQTTTVPVTNGTTNVSATTTAQGPTIGGTNKTSTSSTKPTTTVSNNITMTPTPVGTDKPPQGDGGRHQKLILGLSLGISSIVITAAVGIGCHICRKRKIWSKLKCLKKCFNRSKPSNESESKKELLPADLSDTESGPEGPPGRPPLPDQFEEQEEIGVAEGQDVGQAGDAVPIAEADGIELSKLKDKREETQDEEERGDPPVPESPDSISNKSDSDDSAEPEDGLEDTDQEDSDENDQEECDRLREVPDWIKDLPLTSILNEEDLLDKLKVLLEQEGRTHYKNIGSHLFKLTHDELLHIEYHRVSTSPTVAVLKEGVTRFPSMKIRCLLYYVTGKPLERKDVANCIVKHFTEADRDAVMAKLNQ